MIKIVHISDLHFGREDKTVVNILLRDMITYAPNLVVISGDLTQRARRREFSKAASFIRQIPFEKIIVPGNHDVPLYDITRRFLAPFNRYIRYINDDFFPMYENDQLVVIGINTAYSFTWKSGRITRSQLKTLKDKLQHQGNKLKLLVVHHPFHEIFFDQHQKDYFKELSVDLIFSGHLHQASAGLLSDHIAFLNYNTLLIQAGTAVSTRLRGEKNSYNRLELTKDNILTISIREFKHDQFAEKLQLQFQKKEEQWQAV